MGVLAATLAVVGVCLAGPVSTAFAGAAWAPRTPRAALVLWQAICLGAGLSMVGSLLLFAIGDQGGNLPEAIGSVLHNLWLGRPFTGMTWWQVTSAVLAVALAAHLLGILLLFLLHAIRRRRSHRALVDLLSSPGVSAERQDRLGDIRILDHPIAVAYSLPGRHHRVVLSVGLVDLLTPAELGVVLAHERAHLRARHDLLILPFQAWAAALGVFAGVRRANAAVAELAEMLADDCAARRGTAGTLAGALTRVTLAGGPCPGTDGSADRRSDGRSRSGMATATTTTVTHRVRRLLAPAPLPQAATVGVYTLATLLIVIPTAVLISGWA